MHEMHFFVDPDNLRLLICKHLTTVIQAQGYHVEIHPNTRDRYPDRITFAPMYPNKMTFVLDNGSSMYQLGAVLSIDQDDDELKWSIKGLATELLDEIIHIRELSHHY